MKLLGYVFLALMPLLFVSCEEEEDYGFPSKIKLSGTGETVEVRGSNSVAPSIAVIELLDYDGEGTSDRDADGRGFFETTTDWLTVSYYPAEYKLVFLAEPNETNKKRKLYLFLYNGKSRQEITVEQSKR